MSALTIAEPEDDALDRARTGDHDGFARLVARHESMVFSIAYHATGARDRAEEIAQDVFLQLFRSLSQIESSAHVLFWLRQVTSRRCIDEARRRKRQFVPLDLTSEIASPAKAIDPLRDRLLERLVAELPAAQRLVVMLRYQEDLDLSEISAILGMPLNTVKSHLRRGLRSMRRRVGERP